MIPVAFDLRDPDRSGIARVARSLARCFVEDYSSEFQVTLVGPVDTLESLGAPRWSTPGPRLVDWDAGRYSIAAEYGWKRVKRQVDDAVWYYPHWDVPWHSRPRRYVVTVHDIGHLRIDGVARWRRRLARAWMHSTTVGARRIAVVSDFTRTELIAEWPRLEKKIRLLPNGVDDRFFQPCEQLPEAVASRLANAPFMVSVGIRKRHKNLSVGVDVLKGLPDLYWLVVGEAFPEWNEVVARATRENVIQRMIVLDRVDDQTLSALYHRAVCLFFPSRYEGFGLPIVEALAAGTPVVASSAGASVELLDGVGWTCDPDDARAFARAVTEVLSLGEKRESVAARGRERARGFTWRRSAARLAEMFREIA